MPFAPVLLRSLLASGAAILLLGSLAGCPDKKPKGTTCAKDEDCKDGAVCVDKACVECRDDAQCADDAFCNGRERCLLGVGCRPGPPETCQDQDSCTIDSCDEATKSCKHAPRDLDGDGDPDDRCSANHDCDDQDPDVASTRGEVCSNGRGKGLSIT